MTFLKCLVLVLFLNDLAFSKKNDSSKEANQILSKINQHLDSDRKRADPKDNPAAMCNNDEHSYMEIEHSLVRPLKAALLNLSPEGTATISQLLSAKFVSHGFPFSEECLKKNLLTKVCRSLISLQNLRRLR
jgi:hypothetical protein